MQAVFLESEENINSFVNTISRARLSKYISASNGNIKEALLLYHWNSQLSQSLYLPLQTWEISLRNKINLFLCWKYNPNWPRDQQALRNLARPQNDRLTETIQRQSRDRKAPPTTDQIVADLSAGFWVGLLGKSYDVPFAWRYNLSGRVFKNDATIDRDAAFQTCGRLLDLRNRVAHHEPIFHLNLADLRDDLDKILNGLCGPTHNYMASACSFATVWSAKPAVAGSQGQLHLGS